MNEANQKIRDQVDNLVTILDATSEIREAYDDAFDILFGVCVEAVALYIERWAEMDSAGSLVAFVLDADDLENMERLIDPKAKLETLFRLMLTDALFDNVRHRLGLPESNDDD